MKFKFCLLLAMTSVMTSGCKQQSTKDNTLRIGVLAPKTGIMSGHGESIALGTMLAEKILNESGGILGHRVELKIVDTQSDPATTAENARRLISQDHVQILMGTGLSSSSLAVIPVATAAKTPFIYSLDGECKTSMPGEPTRRNPWVFGSGFTERMVAPALFEALKKRIKKEKPTVYFVGGDYVYPRSTNGYARTVAAKIGMATIGEEYNDTKTQDYSPVIQRILAAAPDLLIVTNPGESGVTFMKQAKLLGLDKKVLISGFATFDQEAISSMGSASEGVYCINRYSMEIDSPINKEFVRRFHAEYPEKPLLPGPTAAAGAYGIIMSLKTACERANSIDPAKVADALRGLEVELPQGKILVNNDNNIFDQPLYLMRIEGQRYIIVETTPRLSHPGFEGTSVK